MSGSVTSVAEVIKVSKDGFSLLLDGEESRVTFEDFPCFENATVEALQDVRWPSPSHLHWPRLDVDVSVESVRDPAAFPLVARRFEA